MAQLDLTTALARLLSDASLRQAYRQDRRGTAERLAVRAADRSGFLSLDPGLLDRQAETLLNKRLHEVRRLLPETFTRMGLDLLCTGCPIIGGGCSMCEGNSWLGVSKFAYDGVRLEQLQPP